MVLLGGSYWLHYLIGLVPGRALRRGVRAAAGAGRAAHGGPWRWPASTVVALSWVGMHPIERPEQAAVA